MRREVMQASSEVCWSLPVWVRRGSDGAEAVWTPREALECLNYRWPNNGGRHQRGARACCLAALTNQLEPGLAREAFVWASAEVEILHRPH
jgi:hypothetical protein